jgi:nucleoside phosphorylase
MSAEDFSADILLYLALKEEFDAAMAMLGDGFKPKELPDMALTGFFGSIASPALGRDFRLAVFPAGKMGNTRSANITSAIIERVKPAEIVVLGIAGSLANDVEPGDVFIPDSVVEYLANSATEGENKSWSFRTSGNHFQTSVRLLNRLQLFAHTQKSHHARWYDDTVQRRIALIQKPIQDAIIAAGLVMRGECKLYVGDDRRLASGPAVGKGKAFLEWLTRKVDRKVAAMEMESAGVYDAAIIRTPAPRTIAIRGISDYADARKDKIEASAKGLFRELAAKNALSLLIRGIEAGLFQPEAAQTDGLTAGVQPSVVQSKVRSVFVIGGVTDETKDQDAELPRLHNASLKLGRALAKTGAQLVICSPFPDSTDYYTAMGYAEGSGEVVIHFHSPNHAKVIEKRRLFAETLGRVGLVIHDWNYPGPEKDDPDSWFQAWLIAQLQALERADAVIALGGKVSKTANTLLHLAEAKGLPIVPFAFLGGAARRAFARRDWKRLNPAIDASVLEAEQGIEKAIEIANQLVVDRVARAAENLKKPKTAFVSFAHKDSVIASALIQFLKSQGLDVLTGDNEIRTDQMVVASIDQALLKCDVCVVLWSQNYALSPWCYDELVFATDRRSHGQMEVWLFNLDDSIVVPPQARTLQGILVSGANGIVHAAGEILTSYR